MQWFDKYTVIFFTMCCLRHSLHGRMKRGQSPAISPSLEAALDKARALLGSAPLDSRTPSMRVPASNLGVDANDTAVELPGIINRNDRAGFYPAQDGYAREPESEQEIRLARQSQYGTDWQRQQRQQQILLDKDPMYRLVNAIAGATQRSIDRFVQGPNQEVIDIQRQRAIEQSRREIAIYGPDFVALDARISSLREKAQLNKDRQSLLETNRDQINVFMKGAHPNAGTARRNGNWWVLPSEINSLDTPQYVNMSVDLEKLFSGDSLAVIRVYDYAMVPTNDYRGFQKSTHVAAGEASITVVPYVYAVYTMGLLKTMKTHIDENSFSTMDVRQLLMMAFLLMNGGSYSELAHEEFKKQYAACDQADLRSLADEDNRKKYLATIASENWHKRAADKRGGLNAAIRATLSLNYTTERGDDSLFYGVSGTDSVPMYRQQPAGPVIADGSPGNVNRRNLLDMLSIFGGGDPVDGFMDTPITLRDLCKKSVDVPEISLSDSLNQNIASIEEIITSFEKPHSGNLFQALLYFAGYFTGFAGLRSLAASGIIDEMLRIENVTKWPTTRSPNTRALVESFPGPVSPFTATNVLNQPVVLSNSGVTISDVVHLRVFTSSVRNIALKSIDDITEEADNINQAIQAAQKRLIDMTRENYDTINRHADKLIMEGKLDITPSLYSMGNSIDYATEPQNIGLIMLTPIAHYGIWVSYQVLQDPTVPDNRIAGLPFDEIIRHTSTAVFFAKFVAAMLANNGLATGAGYQAQVRSARIPHELESAAARIFSFAYVVVRRDPLTGAVLAKPRYRIYQKTTRSRGAAYLVY